mgnify:CR=1 FL=1
MARTQLPSAVGSGTASPSSARHAAAVGDLEILHEAHVMAFTEQPEHEHVWIVGKDATGRYVHHYCACGADCAE